MSFWPSPSSTKLVCQPKVEFPPKSRIWIPLSARAVGILQIYRRIQSEEFFRNCLHLPVELMLVLQNRSSFRPQRVVLATPQRHKTNLSIPKVGSQPKSRIRILLSEISHFENDLSRTIPGAHDLKKYPKMFTHALWNNICGKERIRMIYEEILGSRPKSRIRILLSEILLLGNGLPRVVRGHITLKNIQKCLHMHFGTIYVERNVFGWFMRKS